MGEVYRARDTRLGRDVAIKVLPRAFAAGPRSPGARFEREARVLASLNHPNIGAIHGVEQVDGLGASRDGAGRGGDAGRAAEDAARFRSEEAPWRLRDRSPTHSTPRTRRAIVHRDLKPANVKITPDGSSRCSTSGWRSGAPHGRRRAIVDALATVTLDGTRDGHPRHGRPT